MIPDILSPPTQRSITTLRTLLRTTVLSTGWTLCAISFSFAAELFPFAKDLWEAIRDNLTRDIVPTRKLDGDGRLCLIPA